mgnify:FL=1
MRVVERILPSYKELKKKADDIAFDCLIYGGLATIKGIEVVKTVKIFFRRKTDDLYCIECTPDLEPVREFFFRRILREQL